MKLLIYLLLGCLVLLGGLMFLCSPPHNSTQWGNDLLRITDPDLLGKPPPQIPVKQPYALGSPGNNPRNRSVDNFDPETLITQPFPAIKDAPFQSAEQAEEMLSDSDLVLGVSIGDESRAYPITMLCGPRREIINDTLGGSKIASTW